MNALAALGTFDALVGLAQNKSRRDFIYQPRVARNELPGVLEQYEFNSEGVESKQWEPLVKMTKGIVNRFDTTLSGLKIVFVFYPG